LCLKRRGILLKLIIDGKFKLFNNTNGLDYEISLQSGLIINHDSYKLQISNQGNNITSASQKVTIPYSTDLSNLPYLKSRVSVLKNGSGFGFEGLTVEKDNASNLYIGISKIHTLQVTLIFLDKKILRLFLNIARY
jgi:hypothetical protein